MYSAYRNYFRNRYGYYADGENSRPEGRRRSRRRDRSRWRYNNPTPVYETDFWDFFYDSYDTDEREDVTPNMDAPKPETGAETAEGEAPKPDPPSDVPPFHVIDVDFNNDLNRFDHHTIKYTEHKELIIRRGQEFKLDVKVDKKFEKGEDVIKLQFGMGKTPLESKGTMFIITPGAELDKEEASAVIDDVVSEGANHTIKMRVLFPSNCVVGRFKLCIRMRNKEDAGDDRKFLKHNVDETMIVLFNAWCEEDTVYMKDDDERTEYVLNDTGMVYKSFQRGKKWNFGQFDKESLDAAMYIIDISDLRWEAYGNPVKVSRTISAMVNSNSEDGGILSGNWSGDYEGGTSPSAWNGSVRILEQFMKTKQPVNYGQCWVFSGLTTTVSRALGLPTRSVTNYSSAHDTDESMTIDYHQDENGEPLKHMNDSVWNYHVWNEAWFKRPDLPAGNDGWQAFDATPQESSDGVMQCGPAPLTAIKEGNVHLGYDTKFIFGEVNGDRVTWRVNKRSREKTVIRVDKESVGEKISTKKVGKNEREDLTDQYKYMEGSKEERAVVKKALGLSSRKKALDAFYNKKQINDVDMTFNGEMNVQGDIVFTFNIKNTSNETRTVDGHFHLMAKYYTGTEGDDIDDQHKTFSLEANQGDTFSWTVKAADWINSIDEDATIGAYVTANVKETDQNFIYEQSYTIEKPDLEVTTTSPNCKVWEPLEVTITFTNPLALELTKASFMVEGAGIATEKTIEIQGAIAAGATITEKVTLTPKMVGKREIIASFHSRQLVDIEGSVDIEVMPADE